MYDVTQIQMEAASQPQSTVQSAKTAQGNDNKESFRKIMENCRQTGKKQQKLPEEGAVFAAVPVLDPLVFRMLSGMENLEADSEKIGEISLQTSSESLSLPLSGLAADAKPVQISQNAAAPILSQEIPGNERPEAAIRKAISEKSAKIMPAEQKNAEQIPSAAVSRQEKPVMDEVRLPEQRGISEEKQEAVQDFPVKTPKEAAKEGLAAPESRQIFSDPETVPVKVSETPRMPERTPEVQEQITQKLKEAVVQGEKKLTIHLKPAQLGTIKVELTQKEDGVLHIALHTERSEVKVLLERGLPELQQMVKTNQQPVEIHVEQQEQEKSFYDNPQQHQGSRQQQQQPKPRHQEDFLQQLRLGLIPIDDAAS